MSCQNCPKLLLQKKEGSIILVFIALRHAESVLKLGELKYVLGSTFFRLHDNCAIK